MQISQVLAVSALSALLISVIQARNIPDHVRVRRTASDMRLAELQALTALSKGGGSLIGHGTFNPVVAGKRKRSDTLEENIQSISRDVLERDRVDVLRNIIDKLTYLYQEENLR